jgi:hypothetical protein
VAKQGDRSADADSTHYVVTMPPKTTVLRDGDCVFVLSLNAPIGSLDGFLNAANSQSRTMYVPPPQKPVLGPLADNSSAPQLATAMKKPRRSIGDLVLSIKGGTRR